MRGSGKKILFGMLSFLLFFAIVSFVVTCSFLLFLHGMEFTAEQISDSAKLTFVNILLITLLFWGIDMIRRKLTVERPAQKIVEGLQKITDGDFSEKIRPLQSSSDFNQFNVIIENINKMTEELKGVETLRTDFIANVSHELKTPLSVIQNYGTMLQSPELSEAERVEYAKAITSAARNLASLITNILRLNKLENQQIYPTEQPYNLSEQICECLLQFEMKWEEKNIEIDTEMEEDVIVNTDSELLSLVWNNLFSNAIKFTEAGGRVAVSLVRQGEDILVSVSDSGCGMSAETGRHIFEKFYQGDTSHAGRGNGLGLALVKRVIDIVNGEISVRSELGKGSTFTVKLKGGKDGQVERNSVQ